MKIDRKELEENLALVIEEINQHNSHTEKVKDYLMRNEIPKGITGKYLNQPETLEEVDTRFLALLCMAVFEATRSADINPSDYFTEHELKEARMFSGKSQTVSTKEYFPKEFENTIPVGESAYMTMISVEDINNMHKSNLFNYNFNIQREATYKRKGNQIFTLATLNKKSVDEIAKLLLDGRLVPTTIVLNAAPRSADEGQELDYNATMNKLTINKGTRLDILDGYHRIMGIQRALLMNPNIEMKMPVMITNYSEQRAKQFLGQMAKANPISKARAESLLANSHSTVIINELKVRDVFRNKVSQTEKLHTLNNELVSYSILSDAIDRQFKIKNKRDEMDVTDYLDEFFTALFRKYRDVFYSDNLQSTRSYSLLAHNFMFSGYIVLARRMFEQGISPLNVTNILKVDFDRHNPLWKKLNIINEDGSINHAKSKKAIIKFFEEYPLD